MADTPRQAALEELPRITTEAVADLAQYIMGPEFEMTVTVRIIEERFPDDIIETKVSFSHGWHSEEVNQGS